MAGVVPQKVEEYEAFINERLKRDLQTILDQRDKVYSEIAEYLQLKNTIERIQETHTPGDVLKTRIDLGCNFYVNANVSDTSKIYVHVGYGFYPELTLPEALQFIEKKTKILTSRSEKLTSQASSVKAHIRLVLEGQLTDKKCVDAEAPCVLYVYDYAVPFGDYTTLLGKKKTTETNRLTIYFTVGQSEKQSFSNNLRELNGLKEIQNIEEKPDTVARDIFL